MPARRLRVPRPAPSPWAALLSAVGLGFAPNAIAGNDFDAPATEWLDTVFLDGSDVQKDALEWALDVLHGMPHGTGLAAPADALPAAVATSEPAAKSSQDALVARVGFTNGVARADGAREAESETDEEDESANAGETGGTIGREKADEADEPVAAQDPLAIPLESAATEARRRLQRGVVDLALPMRDVAVGSRANTVEEAVVSATAHDGCVDLLLPLSSALDIDVSMLHDSAPAAISHARVPAATVQARLHDQTSWPLNVDDVEPDASSGDVRPVVPTLRPITIDATLSEVDTEAMAMAMAMVDALLRVRDGQVDLELPVARNGAVTDVATQEPAGIDATAPSAQSIAIEQSFTSPNVSPADIEGLLTVVFSNVDAEMAATAQALSRLRNGVVDVKLPGPGDAVDDALLRSAQMEALRRVRAGNVDLALPLPLALPQALENAFDEHDDAASKHVFGDRRVAVSDDTLGNVRGGFTNAGLNFSFGIERAIYVNGTLVTSTTLNVAELGKTVGSLLGSSIVADPASVTAVQNGSGNTVAIGTLGQGAMGTFLQNTLDGQKIQNVTVINATTNALGVFRNIDLGASLRAAVIGSMQR